MTRTHLSLGLLANLLVRKRNLALVAAKMQKDLRKASVAGIKENQKAKTPVDSEGDIFRKVVRCKLENSGFCRVHMYCFVFTSLWGRSLPAHASLRHLNMGRRSKASGLFGATGFATALWCFLC